ncbi:MAG TPA: hypothetical protein VD994_19260 [Prosthecobacter sp.]|nr:hypothetical protein [Prosthecobacter sp.]
MPKPLPVLVLHTVLASVLVLAAFLAPDLHAQSVSDPTSGWQTISIPDTATFQIPASMEAQIGLGGGLINLPAEPGSKPNLANLCAAVLPKGADLGTDQGQFLFDTLAWGDEVPAAVFTGPSPTADASLQKLDADLRRDRESKIKTTRSMGLAAELKTWAGTNITKVDGFNAVATAFTHTLGTSPPVLVREIRIPNGDRTHLITISYPSDQADRWLTDLVKIFQSLKLIRH